MVLEKSKLIKHQIYFWQSFGCQWLMPISEQECWGGTHIDVLACVDMNELTALPKHDHIRGYMVETKVREGRKVYSTWEIPNETFYKHYCLRLDYLLSGILIDVDKLKLEFPELATECCRYPKGISKDKELKYKRQFLIEKILNEDNLFSNTLFPQG